jgi:Flp pilus assembly pilin Flp
MTSKLIKLLIDDGGATLVEYGILVLLIAVSSIFVLTTLGPKVAGLFAPLAPAL